MKSDAMTYTWLRKYRPSFLFHHTNGHSVLTASPQSYLAKSVCRGGAQNGDFADGVTESMMLCAALPSR